MHREPWQNERNSLKGGSLEDHQIHSFTHILFLQLIHKTHRCKRLLTSKYHKHSDFSTETNYLFHFITVITEKEFEGS